MPRIKLFLVEKPPSCIQFSIHHNMQVSLGLRSILRIGALLAAAALAAAHCPLGQHSLRSGSSRYGNDKIPMANKAFEKFIKDEMGRWNVPGAAVAILDGDKTWARVSPDTC